MVCGICLSRQQAERARMLLNNTLLKTKRINFTRIKNLISKHLTPLLTSTGRKYVVIKLAAFKIYKEKVRILHTIMQLFHFIFIIFITAM